MHTVAAGMTASSINPLPHPQKTTCSVGGCASKPQKGASDAGGEQVAPAKASQTAGQASKHSERPPSVPGLTKQGSAKQDTKGPAAAGANGEVHAMHKVPSHEFFHRKSQASPGL
jgi:hypothetical protein